MRESKVDLSYRIIPTLAPCPDNGGKRKRGKYQTKLPLQLLLSNIPPLQILQNKRPPNLRPPNPLTHLRNPRPSQSFLFHLEINHHAPSGHHEQQRRLPRERACRVARLQLAHCFCARAGGGCREWARAGGIGALSDAWCCCCCCC